MSLNPRSITPCRQGRMASNPMSPEVGRNNEFERSSPQCRSLKSTTKSTIPKRGPPPTPPKKIDYKKPQTTKAMIQRLKHTQRLQAELDNKEQEPAVCPNGRKSRRLMIPSCGGDSYVGREQRANTAENRGRSSIGGSKAPPPCATNASEPTMASSSAYQVSCPPTPTSSKRKHSYPSSCASRRSPTPPPISPRTRNLAKSMNADIVQAEPLQPGPIDSLIIPPGVIDADRTTIVSIPQPEVGATLISSTPAPYRSSQTPTKSVRALNNSLDEQDAAESEAVNSKLQDLQQARRDFVLAVANASGNAINLQGDCSNQSVFEITPARLKTPDPSIPRLIACPSLEDPYLQIKYVRNHPVVEAAREYMQSRKAENTIEENFMRTSCQSVLDDIKADYLEECDAIPTGAYDDDVNDDFYITPRQCTTMPNRPEARHHDPLEIDHLERFFDLQSYPPPSSVPPTPPPSTNLPRDREYLHPDLWELDDPWYKEPCMPDLIDWRDY